MRFGHNFWLGVLLTKDQRVWTAFCKIFSGTPHLTIFGTLKYVPKYGKIRQIRYLGCIFGHIWSLHVLHPCVTNTSEKLFAVGRCVTGPSPSMEWRRKCSPCDEGVEKYEGYNRKDNVEDGGQPEHVDIQVPAGFPYCHCHEWSFDTKHNRIKDCSCEDVKCSLYQLFVRISRASSWIFCSTFGQLAQPGWLLFLNI